MNRPKFLAILAIPAACLLLEACGGSRRVESIPAGGEAYQVVPPPDPQEAPRPYVIGPRDVVGIEVFQEPDFSQEAVAVDNTGNIQMPFIGKITAAGQTPDELGSVIAARLRTRYIVNPQVVVTVVRQATRFVTIEGQIKEPGVYEIDDSYTLLSVIARGKSPTKTAKLDEIVIFRNVGGQRMAGRFNLNDIRGGRAPDPKLQGGDVIVIGNSGVKSAYQELLQALPLVNLFYFLRN